MVSVQDWELQGYEFESRLGIVFTIVSSFPHSLNLVLVYIQEVVALSNMPEKLLTWGTLNHETNNLLLTTPFSIFILALPYSFESILS